MFFSTFFIITACERATIDPKEAFDTPITSYYRFTKIIKLAEAQSEKLNLKEKAFLEELKYLKQDKSEYVASIKEAYPKANEFKLKNYFDWVNEEVINLFEDNELTLNQLFASIDIKEKRLAPTNINEFYARVDQYNLSIQKKIEEVAVIKNKKIEELNETYHVKRAGIEEIQGTSAAYEAPQAYNILFHLIYNADERVDKFKFLITFQDAEMNVLATHLVDESRSGFFEDGEGDTSVSLYFCSQGCYGQTESIREIYSIILQGFLKYQLEGIDFYISTKVLSVTTANHQLPDFSELGVLSEVENHHYKSPEKLNGIGPYTYINKELINESQALNDKIHEIREEYRSVIPLLSRYDDLIESLKNNKPIRNR